MGSEEHAKDTWLCAMNWLLCLRIGSLQAIKPTPLVLPTCSPTYTIIMSHPLEQIAAFHSKFNAEINAHHPSIYAFLEILKGIQTFTCIRTIGLR